MEHGVLEIGLQQWIPETRSNVDKRRDAKDCANDEPWADNNPRGTVMCIKIPMLHCCCLLIVS